MNCIISPRDFCVSPLGTTDFFDINGNLVDKEQLETIEEHAPLVIGEILNLSDLEINGSVIESDGSMTTRDEKKKVKYTPAHLKAQNKYREKNREKYNEAQRLLYEKKIKEEEWKKHYLERSRVNNRKYREKKKEEEIHAGVYEEKKRGRPRKSKVAEVKEDIKE